MLVDFTVIYLYLIYFKEMTETSSAMLMSSLLVTWSNVEEIETSIDIEASALSTCD